MMRGEMKRGVLMLCVILSAAACHRERRHQAGNPAASTQTVAPAAAQPAPTGTDAMTQTVNVEDSRTVDDGGTPTAHPTATATPAKKAPAKKKH